MDAVPRPSRTRRALVAAGWVVLGVIVGFALSTWFVGDRREPDDVRVSEKSAVPEECLAAIRAARERLLLNEETAEVLTSYPDLVRRAADAVSPLDVAELRTLFEEARELNARGKELIGRARTTDFSTPARACEERARA